MRGFVWAVYTDDDNERWAVRVDADQADDPDRGWEVPAPPGTPVLSRGWIPRRAIGLDSDGHRLIIRVGSNSCAIWTGAVSTFTFERSDVTIQLATIIGRMREVQRKPVT